MNNCCIVSIYSFPNGLAPTNRIISYSLGLKQNGINVDILIPYPTDDFSSEKTSTTGNYNGLKYKYSTGRYKSKYKLIRAFMFLTKLRLVWGVFISGLEFFSINKKNKYDAIIISNDTILFLLFYSFLGKILNIKTIFIFDEYPVPIRHKLKSKIPTWKKLFYKFSLINIDGYISITTELSNYYNKIKSKPTLIVSLIINTERFKKVNNQKSLNKTITYVGNMELSKDNLDNIIKAFALIQNKYQDYELCFYGKPNKTDAFKLKSLIEELQLVNKIHFKGLIPADKVPEILLTSKILVSSQPNTKRASGGFPTKLGEYLISGTPSLFTDVGENSKYVKNEIHLFFAKPNDSKDYAKKLEFIINNYDHACMIAKNGKKMVESNFSHISAGRSIKEFINYLN